MSKTLFIHIGHYKTGTTALQIFFSQNQKLLKKAGCIYPSDWLHHAKHSIFAFSILRAADVTKQMYGYDNPIPPKDLWKELFTHIKASKAPKFLISSEEFMRIGQFPKAAEILETILADRPSNLDIKAIVYLRDPNAHIKSWYNQLIKMQFPTSDLNGALGKAIEDIHINYQTALEAWVRILGPQNIILRPYQFNKDDPTALHRDILSALDLNIPAEKISAQKDPNPRFDDRILELVRLMQNLNFPDATLTTIRTRAAEYLQRQDALRSEAYDTIKTAQADALAGIKWLETLKSDDLPLEQFQENLPQAVNEKDITQNLLLGFVLSEFITHRRRLNQYDFGDIMQRLSALEDKIDSASSKKH